jgi:hypothetical protein
MFPGEAGDVVARFAELARVAASFTIFRRGA